MLAVIETRLPFNQNTFPKTLLSFSELKGHKNSWEAAYKPDSWTFPWENMIRGSGVPWACTWITFPQWFWWTICGLNLEQHRATMSPSRQLWKPGAEIFIPTPWFFAKQMLRPTEEFLLSGAQDGVGRDSWTPQHQKRSSCVFKLPPDLGTHFVTSGRCSLGTNVTECDGKKFRLGSQTNVGLDPLLSFTPSMCLKERKKEGRQEAETKERDRSWPPCKIR